MSKIKKVNTEHQLFKDIASLIEDSRSFVANTVNTTLVLLYWKVGKRINSEILKNKRAEYGKQIVVSLTQQLMEKYGKGWDDKNPTTLSPQCGDFLRRANCLRSAETIRVDAYKNHYVPKRRIAA